ncbi:MAG: nucleoside kinase [Ruminococcus sp.]|nr:nucleoside kinase [Ruminococcus sp.]
MNIITTDELNYRIKNDAEEFVKSSEKVYADHIFEIAETLRENLKEKPIVLLSGPSGSGKTTSALRIEALLEKWGYNTHTLSMDSYFLPVVNTPDAIGEDGRIDYESPLRMDIPLLNDHLEKLANGEEIDVPKFNFVEQRREKGHLLKRNKNEIVVIEGIHALNPEITGQSYDFATGIYVSVRTRIQRSNGELLHPSKIRVMRRMIRDIVQRGRRPEDTLDMYQGVERGENLYIMPHKHRAHFDIDTFFDYEVPLYKDRVIPAMERLKEFYPDYEKFSDILGFLYEMETLSAEYVPTNALIREFVGGSDFEY